MDRVYNFSAGPSQLPLEVLQIIQKDLLNYNNTGTSVMEMSHRSADFDNVLASAKTDLKELMGIDDNYEILFLAGGATTQFSMIPMNLLKRNEKAGYLVTGHFAKMAKNEAERYGNIITLASGEDKNYSYIPSVDENKLSDDLKYIHFTGNNTIYGTMFNELPTHKDIPLVADYSSLILGKWIDVSKHGLIYAGAQKNMGTSGVTVVIIDKKLASDDIDNLVPKMYGYANQIKANSMCNTPPCFSIYVCGEMFKWVKRQGGIKTLEKINKEKSKLLYEFIDNSKIYKNNININDRSIMNVTFNLTSEEMTNDFINYCKDKGIVNIKGHKVLGGCRASIYNGMPLEGVEKLIETMKEFEVHGKY